MESDLKLLIFGSASKKDILEKLKDDDKNRLECWYKKATGVTINIDVILDVFIWCCTEGAHAADTHNPQFFTDSLKKKADEIKVSSDVLSNLYFSYSTLFKIYDNIITKPSKSLFIVFEGLDGSGKSTQIKALKDKLLLMGRKVYVTAEPTNSATGGLIRDTLSNNYKREPSELAGLFLTDRISHNMNPIWGIKKFLDQGIDVICDRYYYSSFAYQGLDTDLKWIMDMNLNCPNIAIPDLCIFLDVEPHECKERIDRDRPHLEIFENDEVIMSKIRLKFYEVFQKLNHTENIKIVSATNRSPEIVADEIYQTVIKLKTESLKMK